MLRVGGQTAGDQGSWRTSNDHPARVACTAYTRVGPARHVKYGSTHRDGLCTSDHTTAATQASTVAAHSSDDTIVKLRRNFRFMWRVILTPPRQRGYHVAPRPSDT